MRKGVKGVIASTEKMNGGAEQNEKNEGWEENEKHAIS